MATSIEVFTGAGGLALGLLESGFHHELLVELDKHSCATLTANRHRFGIPDNERIEPLDATNVDWKSYSGRIDLMAGGVPCQPFSLGGKHRGHEDNRNLFPAMIQAVREVEPAVVVIENVKGLLRPAFAPYYQYILRQLSMPEMKVRTDEDWVSHDRRLLIEAKHYRRSRGLAYRVRAQLLQAANYGVPQTRERVFVVAYRDDLDAEWSPPAATHSEQRLVYEQWVTGTYWREHNLPRPKVPERMRTLVDSLRDVLLPPETERWRTVRDALRGLPEPHRRRQDGNSDHFANPGARPYPGHMGSPLEWPAKTLKAGVHGVPGGENTLRHGNGRIRYFTVREAARIQTFPDDYRFPGTWGECFRQLGNAVPVRLGTVIGDQVARVIASAKTESSSRASA